MVEANKVMVDPFGEKGVNVNVGVLASIRTSYRHRHLQPLGRGLVGGVLVLFQPLFEGQSEPIG